MATRELFPEDLREGGSHELTPRGRVRRKPSAPKTSTAAVPTPPVHFIRQGWRVRPDGAIEIHVAVQVVSESNVGKGQLWPVVQARRNEQKEAVQRALAVGKDRSLLLAAHARIVAAARAGNTIRATFTRVIGPRGREFDKLVNLASSFKAVEDALFQKPRKAGQRKDGKVVPARAGGLFHIDDGSLRYLPLAMQQKGEAHGVRVLVEVVR